VTPFLLVLAVLLGFAPGMIAHGKGRNFFLWWLYGVVLGPVALVHAMMLRDTRRPSYAEGSARQPSRWDSPWPLLLWATSSFAVAIITIAAYYIAVPGKYALIAAKNEAPASTGRGAGDTPASAQQLSSIEPQPQAAVTARPEPEPEVKVTVRRDDIPKAEMPRTAHTPMATAGTKPAPAAAEADPAPEPAAAPQPPAATAETLERTIATTADSVPEAASPKAAPIKDVRTARAMPAPPPDADETVTKQPKSAAQPRVKASRPAPPKRHAEHKPAAAKPSPTDVNAVGEIVRTVQQALAARGYEPGAANGRAGRQTQQAIRKFQADRGLEPTGAIDYALLEGLNIVGPRVHAFQPPPGATAGR
jgi:peptidoglycan hydrolase-like protein with peptidoglycan-binding domain